MNKPMFGKWASVDDVPIPEYHSVLALSISRGGVLHGTAVKSRGFILHGGEDSEFLSNITHWMPEPSEDPNQDAFTELRALVEKYEKFLDEVEVKGTAFTHSMLDEIREVIDE